MDISVFQELYGESEGCRWQKVLGAVEEGMRRGLLMPGDALPTQRSLAESLGVTVGTVTRA
ncbi:MAG: GntR family transcriptional regulator [Mailhella sp.]|nr:GntR family transcriptional regulator [Mailhella sp.]